MQRHRIVVMALIVVAFVTVLPDAAYAARVCQVEPASTPAERAELWRGALASFTAERPNLTAEQTQLLAEAASLGNEISTLKQDAREQAAFARKAARMLERAREIFSTNELGELFTGMGQTQIWLAEVASSTPYCNCVGSTCKMGGGPSGVCADGCVTWTQDGTRLDGVCSAAEEQ